MSSKTKTTAMKEKAGHAAVPKLRFPEFRDSPKWEQKEVGEVFQVTRGNVLSMTLVQDEKTDAMPYPVYSSQTKNNGLSGYYSDFLFEDAITWTTDGANAGDVNFRTGKFFCTNVCGVLLNSNGFANPCIAALINSISRNYVSYVGNPKLMNGVMSKIPIPFPPVAEQQKIAECLSSVDELIAAQAQKVEALKTHKKGLMQQLFPREGETQPRLRFPEFQNAGEWVSGSLDGVLLSISNGLSLPQSAEGAGYKVTRIETISAGMVDLEKVGFVKPTQDVSAYKLGVGEILFSNINSLAHIGKSVFVDRDYDLYHGMNLLRLVVDPSKGEPKFVFYLINTSDIRESLRERANKAVNQASINQTELGKTELSFPPLSEQNRIASCLSSLDDLITAETQKLDALKTHKKGLMQQLFPSPEAVEP